MSAHPSPALLGREEYLSWTIVHAIVNHLEQHKPQISWAVALQRFGSALSVAIWLAIAAILSSAKAVYVQQPPPERCKPRVVTLR